MNLSSVSVVIPVYQCAERLPAHIDCLRMLSPMVHELIWVITESPDGSHQIAREAAKKLGGQVLDVPRGLYQAWNAGIGATTGDFIYISTVGDTIETEGLATLHRTLEETGADLVFSTPLIYPPSPKNRKNTRHWPVFRFASLLDSFAGRKIPGRVASLVQVLAGASGLTGSAASCLFRASVLKSRPFPINHHHYGDTAWLFQYLPEISLAYCPLPLARFVIHGTEIRRVVNKKSIYNMILFLAERFPEPEQKLIRDLVESSRKLDALRDPHPRFGWWWMPSSWKARWKRNAAQRSLLKGVSSTCF